MPETSLRAYVKELDELIEHNQLDEVIAHCRHILQTYPKHLDVYRLLGKAYLEAKRYGDAADIFQRVLSAIPDDFVAHVGMAIVREDEGNLDAAIWHMERAFETNPSNPAIQQELRRLIGRRDGLEPHKVRLTRGALARMYAHGELFPQAIAELRSALQEDPDRPDLMVLLADMYWRTGQRTEAADVCQRILETLPFCREANRIMATALQAGGRSEEAVAYHRRLASLEPYAALVETAMDDPNRVEANAVRIEKLSWVAGQPIPGGDGDQPEWATSLGVDARKDVVKPMPKRPSWLESLETETAAARAAPAAQPKPAVAPSPPATPPLKPDVEAAPPAGESPIPDWMRGAGWQESKGEAVEGPVSFDDNEIAALESGAVPAPEGELARADIPDWLQEIAPPEGLPEAQEPQPASAPPGEASWLGAGAQVASDEEAPRLPPGWGTSASTGEPRADETAAPAVPTWMEEAAPGATETIVTWLGDRSKEALGRKPRSAETPPPKPPEPEPEPEMTFDKDSIPEGVPDWLAEEVSLGGPQGPAAAEAPAESAPPAWLSGVAAAAAEGEALRPEEMPWLKAEAEQSVEGGMYTEEPEEPASPAAEVPDWIKAIAGSEPAAEPEAFPASAEPQPDWLREPVGDFDPKDEQPAPSPSEEEGQGLDWLRSLAEAEEAAETEAAETEAAQAPAGRAEPPTAEPPGESLAWLRDLAEAEPPSPPEGAEAPDESGAPSWLQGIAEERPARDALGRSSAPEWLRGIAEPEPEPAAEIPEEATLDWMRGIAEAEPVLPSAPETPSATFAPPTEPAPSEEPAEWLNMLSPSASEGPGAELATGEWLRALKAEAAPTPEPPSAPAESAPMASESALDDEQVFQWLEDLASRQGIEPVEEIPPAAPPVSLAPPVPSAPSAPAQPQPAFTPPPAEGLEWLEQLAADRGVETGEELPAVPAPAPSPEVPDWLKELVAEAPAPTSPTVPVAAKPPTPAPVPPPTPPAPPAADETLPALPDWMIASPVEETEPAFSMPPSEAKPPEPIPAPPIEELSETWVPPWESIELETREEAAPQPEPEPIPEPPAPVWTPVQPPEETVFAPPRRPSPIDETIVSRREPVEERPARPWEPTPPPAPPVEPTLAPSFPDEIESEIPDWLQTPIPYAPAREEVPEPAVEPEDELPDWLRAPITQVAPREEIPASPPAPQPVIEIKPEVPGAPAYVAPQPPPPIPAPVVPAPPVRMETPPEPTPPPAAIPVVEPRREEPKVEMPPAYVPPPATVVQARPPEPIRVEPPPPAPVPEPVMEVRRPEPVPPAMPPAAPAAKPPARAPRAGRARPDPSQHVDAARKALATGDYTRAASNYAGAIKRNFDLQAVIDELRLALDRNPHAAVLWQALGDAYMKADRVPDAIEAYRRGMEAA